MRDVLVALTSAAVVALVVGYALAGPTPELEASVGPPVPLPGATAVVQGRALKANGDALAGLRVAVRRGDRAAANTVTGETGEFRVELAGACATYDISLRAHAEGADVQTDARRRLCPGDALPIEARVVTQGHFIWVPGPR